MDDVSLKLVIITLAFYCAVKLTGHCGEGMEEENGRDKEEETHVCEHSTPWISLHELKEQ